MSAGEIERHDEDRGDDRPRPAPDEPRGQDRDRDPHHLEVLVHVEVDRAQDDDVRDHEQRDEPRDEEPARRQAAGRDGRDEGEDERDPEVGQRRRRRPPAALAEPRLAPARDEPERAGRLCWKMASAMNGTARTTGARKSAASRRAVGARHAPVVTTYRPTMR